MSGQQDSNLRPPAPKAGPCVILLFFQNLPNALYCTINQLLIPYEENKNY